MDVASPTILREAVARDGHKCVLCSRPCKADDVWRRAEPTPFGDSADNFVAMCKDCLPSQIGKAPPPARYVVHIYDTTRLRRTLRKASGWALIAISALSWLGLAAIMGWLLLYATRGFGSHILATASILALLLAALQVWLGWTGRVGPPVQRYHHSFDPQVLRVEDR